MSEEENRHDRDEKDNDSAGNKENFVFDTGNSDDPVSTDHSASPVSPDNHDFGSPSGMKFEFRVNVSEADLDRLAGAHRAAAIRMAAISAVLFLVTLMLPSFSDEEMTFPASMLFWFVLVLTATRTVVSLKDILRDRDYFVQNVIISSLLAPLDGTGDASGTDGSTGHSGNDAALRELREQFLESFRVRFIRTRIFHFVITLIAVYGTTYFGDFLIRTGLSSLSVFRSILVAVSFTLLFLLAMRTMYLSCILTKEAFFRMATSDMIIRSGKNPES